MSARFCANMGIVGCINKENNESSDATFELFDRVINVKLNLAEPFGLRGTVIGIHQGNIDFYGL